MDVADIRGIPALRGAVGRPYVICPCGRGPGILVMLHLRVDLLDVGGFQCTVGRGLILFREVHGLSVKRAFVLPGKGIVIAVIRRLILILRDHLVSVPVDPSDGAVRLPVETFQVGL